MPCISRPKHFPREAAYEEYAMAHIDECVPGRRALVLRTGVARVAGKTGTIVEVSRTCRPPGGRLQEQVTLDIPGHGEVAFSPADIELVKA